MCMRVSCMRRMRFAWASVCDICVPNIFRVYLCVLMRSARVCVCLSVICLRACYKCACLVTDQFWIDTSEKWVFTYFKKCMLPVREDLSIFLVPVNSWTAKWTGGRALEIKKTKWHYSDELRSSAAAPFIRYIYKWHVTFYAKNETKAQKWHTRL